MVKKLSEAKLLEGKIKKYKIPTLKKGNVINPNKKKSQVQNKTIKRIKTTIYRNIVR